MYGSFQNYIAKPKGVYNVINLYESQCIVLVLNGVTVSEKFL